MDTNGSPTLAERLVTVAADVARLGVPDEARISVSTFDVGVYLSQWDEMLELARVDVLDTLVAKSPGLWTATVERDRIHRGGKYRLRATINGLSWVVTADLVSDASVDTLTARLADTAAAGAA